MSSDAKKENQKHAAKKDDRTDGRSPSNPRHPSVSRPRSESIAVPPIRSLTVRDPLHYNSAANLRDGHEDQVRERRQHDEPSAQITQTIEALQRLLREAVDIAEGVNQDSVATEKTNSPKQPITSPKHHHSNAISFRGRRYLEKGPKSGPGVAPPIDGRPRRRISFSISDHRHAVEPIRACLPAHKQENSDNKSQPADPLISRTPKADLVLLFPDPIAEPSRQGRKTLSKQRSASRGSMTREDVLAHIQKHGEPPILPRKVSFGTRSTTEPKADLVEPPALQLNGGDFPVELEELMQDANADTIAPRAGHERHFTQIFGIKSRQGSIDLAHADGPHTVKIDLKRKSHVDVRNKPDDIDLHEYCGHAPIARDWPTSRKRFAAIVVCMNSASIGLLIGIYSGEVPAIQYVIADFHHYAILGNVFLYCGLAIPTLLLWPLPLLHGRKPYSVGALALALCLQIPQGIAVGNYRSPDVTTYRVLLLLSRAFSGFALGFANINVQATLLDVFGSSLQSHHPHGELVDKFDVRRHGGGMGLWLGFWSWCTIGTIAIGFVVGTFIIGNASVTWGFWTSLLILMFVLLINVIAPEVRRSAFRRTIAELTGEGGAFSRVARGEIKMHLEAKGPYWWGDEVQAGIKLCWLMVQQPGFLVIAVYTAWVYAQFTMILMLLGALASTYYRFKPLWVGVCALSLTLGALFAVPFQKASLFSRARSKPPRTDSMTFQQSFMWSSHLVRRIVFTVLLPLVAIGYTLSSRGPPFPIAVPCVMATLVGFFSNLAIAECYGLMMENFDTSDLQAGMTGRPATKSAAKRHRGRRTNFSCYPRVSAAVAFTQSLQFILGAAVTGLCGRLQRRMGSMQASAIVSGILLGLTLMLTVVLWRWKDVQMIPSQQTLADRRERQSMTWEPVILGNPSGLTRKINLLEAGKQTRWSEIRRRNRLTSSLALT